MKRSIYSVLICASLITISSVAQTAGEFYHNYSGLSLGLAFNEMKEASINKAVHKGPGIFIGFFHEQNKGRIVHRFEFLLASHFMKSKFEDEIASYNFTGTLRYRYLYNVCDPRNCPPLYLGGSINLNTQITYFDNWDENHFYWNTAYSFDFDSRIERKLWSDKIQLELGIPVIALVSRPPVDFSYTQDSPEFLNVIRKMNEKQEIKFPFRHFSADLLLRYCLLDDSRIKKNFFWESRYLGTGSERRGNLDLMTHRLGLELIF